jgi:hypothetical protein
MTDTFLVRVADKNGLMQTKEVSMEIYQEANDAANSGRRKSPIDCFNAKFEGHDDPAYLEKYGTPFEQACMQAHLFTSSRPSMGYTPPTLAELRNGQYGISAAGFNQASTVIVAPDGADALKVGGRLLFPMTILQWYSSELLLNPDRYDAAVANMIAKTVSVNGALYATPILKFTDVRNSKAGAITQGTEPDLIAAISISDTSQRIKTLGYALSITDQAAAATSLDLVGLALQQFRTMERHNRLQADLVDCINGSLEKNIPAVASKTAKSYDDSITSAGVLTQTAYMKWLTEDWMYMSISHLLGDMGVRIAIDARVNRPTVLGDPGTGRPDVSIEPRMMGLPDHLEFFKTTDNLFGANVLVGIDKALAFRKVIDISASYAAVQQFVLSRLSQFVFTFGERIEPVFYDSRGVKKLTLTV